MNPERALETWKAAVESRLEAMQMQADKTDERIGNLIEIINLLRGDKQRLEAELRVSVPIQDLQALSAPVSRGKRPPPDDMRREGEHPAPSFKDARG